MRPGEHKDIRIPFGQAHKGELIADVPNSYLDWLEEQEWVAIKFPVIFKQVKIEREYRKRFNIEI